nr:39S ribosomal protein L32, mitochondrial [Hydra vulgaris]
MASIMFSMFKRLNKVSYSCMMQKKSMSLVAPTSFELLKENLDSLLENIWNGFLWAAPKKRRSISKRRYLRKFRELKLRDDIEDCVVCGNKKLMGKLCQNCFQWTMSLTEETWKKQREEGKCRRDRYVR